MFSSPLKSLTVIKSLFANRVVKRAFVGWRARLLDDLYDKSRLSADHPALEGQYDVE